MLSLVLAGLLASTPLSERHRAWLEEEATYIITSLEKEVFLKLSSDEERESFVAAFWEARDPTPGTRRNEFREDHLARLKEANRLFGGGGRPGWRTERGRIFILLGAPRERRSFDFASNRLWPVELWFYEVRDQPNLPPHFYLLFYRRGGVGEYRLWDPVVDGPAALLVGEIEPVAYDRARVLSIFQSIDSDLYQAVTSPVPGEGSGLSSQFSYQKLVAILEDFPNQTVPRAYSDRYRPGQGIVKVDYAFRKLNLAPLVALLPSAAGPFLHYALEIDPQEVTYAQYKTSFYTVFDLEVELATTDGRAVDRIQDRREIEISEADWTDASRRPLSLQGRFPLVPGAFRLRFLVRSRTGRVFDSYETALEVPEAIDASPLLPAGFFQAARNHREGELPFQFGRRLVVPHPRATYRPAAALRAFLLLGPAQPQDAQSQGAQPQGMLSFEGRILKGGELVHRLRQDFGRSAGGQPSLVGIEVSLGGLAPGDYVLELDLGPGKTRVMSFRIEPGQEAVPPLVNAPEEPPAGDAEWSLKRARQHLALQQNGAALARLEEAVALRPELETARLQLGVLAVAIGQPERALAGIEPGLMRAPFHYDLLALAGFACEQLGRPADAVRYYERARQARQPEEKLLRALASLYERLGDREKAEAVRRQIGR